METTAPGQKGQTRGTVSSRETDVREQVKEEAKCFFTVLWQLNGDRGRGAPSKEYLERVRARDLLVASYVASYDVSINPTLTEGKSMQSVKNNRRSLVEQWWHCSSGRAQQLRDVNEWSTGLKPTVFQKALVVHWESATEGMGEGAEGNDKAQTDEDEQ
jgi:hypothetical protein